MTHPDLPDPTDSPTPDVDAVLAADVALMERPVRDLIAELTADDPEDPSAPPLDHEGLRKLRKLKLNRTRYTAMARALGPYIDALELELVENVAPHRGPDGHWTTTVGDATGYLATELWPKRRVDEVTGEAYDTDALIAALTADQVNHLIGRQVNAQSLAAWLRELVAAWAARCGEEGVRNARGELVDAFGNALDADEVLDPTAPELGLPPHVRKVITVSARMKIAFRTR